MYAILGTGISSLILAHLLIRRGVPGDKIVIIEQMKKPGGLFGSLMHDANTSFDIGMHTIQLSGNKEIDDILLCVVESDEWCKFLPPKHDLAGVILGNQLFENGPYFNLDFFQNERYSEFSRNLRSHLNGPQSDGSSRETRELIKNSPNARVYLEKKFGRELAEETYIRALQMRYSSEAEKLDAIATQLTPMDRILAFKEFRDEELLGNEKLRQTIAWSNQRNLPMSLSSRRPVYYPKKGHIYMIIERLIELLKIQNVNFEFDTKIEQIEIKNHFITDVNVSTSGKSKRVDITKMYWTGNTANLLKLLGDDNRHMELVNPMKTCVVTIKVDRKHIKKSDCMYFFNYLNETGLYRLNNYDAYAGIDRDEKQAKLSLEYIIGRNTKLLSEQVIKHLGQIDFLDSKTEEISLKIHEMPQGHPFPSISNIQAEAIQLGYLNEHDIRNLFSFGSSLFKKRFFQKEVLIHLLEAIDNV